MIFCLSQSTGARARNECARPSASAQPPPGLHLAPLTPLSERGGTPPPPLTSPEPSSALLQTSSSSPPRYRVAPLLLPLHTASLCATPLRVHPPCAWPHCSRAPLAHGAPLCRREGGAREPGLEGEREPTASPALSRKERTGRGGVGCVNQRGSAHRSLAPPARKEGVGRILSQAEASCAL